MKLAVISDVHFGDAGCKMIDIFGNLTPQYLDFKDAIFSYTGNSPLNYLVLNGDVLDFSIAPMHKSLKIAKPFFNALRTDNIAEEIIYIPGNHDKQIWDAVEWETNIVNNMQKKKDPKPFRRVQPGYLDLTKNANEAKLDLPGVSPGPDGKKYGGLYMEGLFDGEAIPINILYPNLYIKSDFGNMIVTHGHMLEQAWVLLSDLLAGIDGITDNPGLKELEEYNIPLTSMVCTGVGQAGAVSELFYKIQVEAKNGKNDTMKMVFDKIEDRLDDIIKVDKKLIIGEILDDIFIKIIKKAALSVASGSKETRGNTTFVKDREVRQRLISFYKASVKQMRENGYDDWLDPTHFIFGHTHVPCPAKKSEMVDAIPQLNGKDLRLYNSGGWLGAGAEIIFISENGIESKSVEYIESKSSIAGVTK